jgi:hypothetical protein
MRLLTIALTLATATAATAQGFQLPLTITLTDNKTGEKVGTATTMPGSGVLYIRDNKGKFIATVVKKDDKVEAFDENGKLLTQVPDNISVPETK